MHAHAPEHPHDLCLYGLSITEILTIRFIDQYLFASIGTDRIRSIYTDYAQALEIKSYTFLFSVHQKLMLPVLIYWKCKVVQFQVSRIDDKYILISEERKGREGLRVGLCGGSRPAKNQGSQAISCS